MMVFQGFPGRPQAESIHPVEGKSADPGGQTTYSIKTFNTIWTVKYKL